MSSSAFDPTLRPILGDVQAQWSQRNGQPVLILQNALGLSPAAIALPEPLSLLPSLCDGTRDVNGLMAAMMIRAGLRLTPDTLIRILSQMDDALLFENGKGGAARQTALQAYRQAPDRPPISAGASYPADPSESRAFLDQLMRDSHNARGPEDIPWPVTALRGVVSPHIDYPRGGAVYAPLWKAAAPAVAEAGLIVILGVDHRGTPGVVTLTRQSYRTPWGIMPTDRDAVDHLVEVISAAQSDHGPFDFELHHAIEHSVELAVVWAHYIAGVPKPILPLICGSFAPFVTGDQPVDSHAGIMAAVRGLRELAEERRVLFVAAVDFAHMGPAFGGMPVTPAGRAACRAADEELLRVICAGDAEGFLQRLRGERDRRNVCGIPALYMLLRVLGPAAGIVTGYAQCPADSADTSIVSIAGALLW